MKKTYNLPKDVVDYLEKQDNMSACITRAIRAEMNNNNLENTVKEIVNKILDNKNTLPDKRV